MQSQQSLYGRRRVLRSRSGCALCRRRKVKCDETRPECQRCQKSGQSCTYGEHVKWLSDGPQYHAGQSNASAEDKNSQGALVESKRASTCWPFLNTTFDDLSPSFSPTRRNPLVLQPEESPLQSFMDAACPLPPIGLSTMPEMTEVDTHLFQYYTRKICPMYALIDSNNNTYDNVIVPLTQHSPLLLRAVLALSANHLKPRNPNYLTVALDYRGSVLAALFHALNHQPHSLSKTEIVASVLMLCFCDLPDDRQGDWRKHFYGVRQLINLPSQRVFSSTDNALLSYLGQYFAPRVILAYSALDNPANEVKMVEAASFWLTKIDRPEREINCVSGCSTELVRVIFDIVQQVRRWLRYPDQRTEIRAWKEATEHTLRTIRQLVPATATSASNTGTATEHEVRQSAERAKRAEQMAETYRLTAVILLQYLEDDVWQRSSTVKACVRSILDLMEVIDKPGEHAKTCSIWPWFIASCHASSDAERLHVLRKYAVLVDEDWYGNTLPVAQVLAEKTWLKHDMDGYCGAAGARERPGNGFFPWEEALMGLGMDFTWS